MKGLKGKANIAMPKGQAPAAVDTKKVLVTALLKMPIATSNWLPLSPSLKLETPLCSMWSRSEPLDLTPRDSCVMKMAWAADMPADAPNISAYTTRLAQAMVC